jgi:membrane associated rhomboid family serine protease
MMIIPLGDDVEKRNLPIVSILLAGACVLGFIQTLKVGMSSPGGYALKEFITVWGLVPTDLAKGRYVGILTHMFLHGGLSHLLGNLIVFWAFAPTLEDTLGSMSFLALYLFWGVVGALTQASMSWGENIPMIGASGAIAGVIGAYCVNYGALTNIRTLIWVIYPVKTQVPACIYVLLWLASQLFGLLGAEEGGAGVAWSAHIGGFAAGSITMLIIGSNTKRRLVERHGVLQLEDADDLAHPDTGPGMEFYAETATAAPTCPQCGTLLDDSHKIGDNLMRCPNPHCARLVYSESAGAVAR